VVAERPIATTSNFQRFRCNLNGPLSDPRFPPPRPIDDIVAALLLKDSGERKLGCFYDEKERPRARRITANIAKVPGLRREARLAEIEPWALTTWPFPTLMKSRHMP
jgi:hypothetical protein